MKHMFRVCEVPSSNPGNPISVHTVLLLFRLVIAKLSILSYPNEKQTMHPIYWA